MSLCVGIMEHWVRMLIKDLDVDGKAMSSVARAGLSRLIAITEAMEPHQFRTDELAGLADAMAECTELAELSRLMWTAATSTGFENFIIFVIRNGSNGTPRSRVCTSCNADWIARYQEMNYHLTDPVMAAAREGSGYFLFSDLHSASPPVAAFWEDAKRHRIGDNGLCFMIDRPDRCRIGVSFLTAKSVDQTRANARLNGYDLMVLANLAVDAFCYMSYGTEGMYEQLSEEELRFLNALATWHRPEEAFDITARFGSNKALQSSIRRKLGAETVFQAIAIASARGYFDDMPFTVSEVTRPFPALGGLDAEVIEKLDPAETE